MKMLDEILEALDESEWRSLEEVRKQVKLDDAKAQAIFLFLAAFGFMEMDETGMKAKLTPLCQRFLKELRMEPIHIKCESCGYEGEPEFGEFVNRAMGVTGDRRCPKCKRLLEIGLTSTKLSKGI